MTIKLQLLQNLNFYFVKNLAQSCWRSLCSAKSLQRNKCQELFAVLQHQKIEVMFKGFDFILVRAHHQVFAQSPPSPISLEKRICWSLFFAAKKDLASLQLELSKNSIFKISWKHIDESFNDVVQLGKTTGFKAAQLILRAWLWSCCQRRTLVWFLSRPTFVWLTGS